MAIPSGLSSQIVCGPGVFFPAFRSTFWCLFWVWGPSRTTWFPALNLTGIWTSILTHFWVTFLLFCRCYFQRIFVVFPDPLFSQLSSKMNAFGEPTGSSGDAFSKVFVAKAKSRKVTFCLDRTPYIEIRGGSDRSVASVFSTPALREAPPMEKESRNRFSFGFQGPAATRLGSFSGTILQSRKKL